MNTHSVLVFAQLAFLTQAWLPRYYTACIALFQVFHKHRNTGFLGGKTDASMTYKAVKRLLGILKLIVCKDTIDFSFDTAASSSAPAIPVGDIISHGMSLVRP